MGDIEFHNRWEDVADGVKTAFDDHGYVVLRGFLSVDEVADVRRELDRYIAHVIPTIPVDCVFYEDKDDPATLKQLPNMQEHDAYFENMLRGDTRFYRLAESLVGGVVGRNLQLLRKPPVVGLPTPAHQDGYYYMVQPVEGLTMWLGLDVADEENGGLRYVKGSHQLGLRPHSRTQTLGFSQGITDYGNPYDLEHERMYTAEPGDLLVHHALTVHRADGNKSADRPRAALGFVYLSDQVKENAEGLEAYRTQLAADWLKQGKI
ncbi:MAG: phytanoyl-CoA hydroxylase [Candidatus Latescibacterota bacterium]|jgi:phytanoyl-CoA hydroxylase